ncbi:MAG: dihydroorotate dehydrogenase electron transfer subunit [Clostridiales bacterium]|nr:dihydroorotate dehydrogenase electron transfer subunit [Clostridiales bacterium]
MRHKLSIIVDIVKLNDQNIRLILQNSDIASKATPGQFVNVRCCNSNELILRRPISILNTHEDCYDIIYKIVGEGTKRLSNFKIGESLDVLGPLGKGFTKEPLDKTIAFIGGGIGLFPLVYAASKFKDCDIDFFVGFRNNDEIMIIDEIKKTGANVYISTDDGSFGYHGFITDLFSENIKKYDKVYICGPLPMEKACVKILRKHGIKGQVSLEERMGCGIGACLVCACETIHGMKHVCKDGPVFNISDVFLKE